MIQKKRNDSKMVVLRINRDKLVRHRAFVARKKAYCTRTRRNKSISRNFKWKRYGIDRTRRCPVVFLNERHVGSHGISFLFLFFPPFLSLLICFFFTRSPHSHALSDTLSLSLSLFLSPSTLFYIAKIMPRTVLRDLLS